MVKYAAILFTLIAALVCVFQLALVFGAPWGEFTLGGKWRGKLPRIVRLIPVLSIALINCFIVVILARAEIAFIQFRGASVWLAWVVVAYCTVGSIANALTTSRKERRIWLPVALCMLGLSLTVASS